MTKHASQDSFGTRLRRTTRYYVRGLYREITEKNLFLWAQAIAFKVLVTIVPVMILTTGLIGRVLRSEQPFDAVAQIIRDFLPPAQSAQIINFLADLHGASGALTVIGAIGLFLSAVSLFITLRITVSNAFEKDWHVGRSLLGGYLFDVRMVVQVGLLFVLTIGLSFVARSLGPSTVLGWFGLDYAWLRAGWRTALHVTGLLAPFLITTAMFFQLYYFVPQPHPRKRSALLGALITSVLWEGMKYGFTYYATYVGLGDYADAGLTALGNTFGLIIAFVFWVYFSSIVLMIGAVIASLHDHLTRLRAKEAEEQKATAQEVDQHAADADEPDADSSPAAPDESEGAPSEAGSSSPSSPTRSSAPSEDEPIGSAKS